jgi:hypothetical protein
MIAINSVFIAKENIPFLEEWIDYHIQVGFDRFFLYDNSKVNKINHFNSVISPKKNMIAGKINKYGINFDALVKLSESEICDIMDKITKKYPNIVNFIEWSPRDKDGFVNHDQEGAHNDCLSKLKNTDIKWCASIDMDEFIVIDKKFDYNIKNYIKTLKSEISCINMSQILYDTRFNNMDTLITSINKAKSVPSQKSISNKYISNKYIYRICDATKLYVHHCNVKGSQIHADLDDIRFNYYRVNFNNNSKDFMVKDNKISNAIIDKIKENSKEYIYKSY